MQVGVVGSLRADAQLAAIGAKPGSHLELCVARCWGARVLLHYLCSCSCPAAFTGQVQKRIWYIWVA